MDFAAVQTYLRRLEAKGYVRSAPAGHARVYAPKVQSTTVIRETVKDLIDRLFGGDAVPLMQHLIKDCDRRQVGRGHRACSGSRVDARSTRRPVVCPAAVAGAVALVVSSVGLVGRGAGIARGRAVLRRRGVGRVAVQPGSLRALPGRYSGNQAPDFPRAGVSRRWCHRGQSRKIGANHENWTRRLPADSLVVLGRGVLGGNRRLTGRSDLWSDAAGGKDSASRRHGESRAARRMRVSRYNLVEAFPYLC